MAQLKICPKCGTSLEDFRRSGLLGCAECYNVFREEILFSVRKMQWGVLHEGKNPVDALLAEQEELRMEIEEAELDGRYEEADRLRGELKILENITESR